MAKLKLSFFDSLDTQVNLINFSTLTATNQYINVYFNEIYVKQIQLDSIPNAMSSTSLLIIPFNVSDSLTPEYGDYTFVFYNALDEITYRFSFVLSAIDAIEESPSFPYIPTGDEVLTPLPFEIPPTPTPTTTPSFDYTNQFNYLNSLLTLTFFFLSIIFFSYITSKFL